jgi:hypothetical protein
VKSKIDIFKSKDGIEVQVNLDKDTVWLSQLQMQDLFLKSKATISEHIRNIFKENELEENVVVRKFRTTTQHGAISGKTQSSLINLYNLDVIISVGYRVKSERGTQFRIWATNTLREHLIKGYSINEKRLEQLQKTIQLVQRTSKLTKDTEGLIDVLADYSCALDILDSFDHQTLTRDNVNNFVSYQIEYAEAKLAIESLKIKFGGSSLFGNEKDNSFKSSIATIDQTFDGKELYTSIEEKAVNLCVL